MATILKINYLRTSDIDGVDFTDKITVSSDRVIDIKCHSSGGQIETYRHDFSNAVSKPESCQSPNGYSDLIYRYMVEDDDLTVWIACVVPDDTELPDPDYQEYTVSDFPTYIFLAEGQRERLDTPTNSPSWVADLSSLTYAEKQKRAVEKVKAWRSQKEAWLVEVQKYSDLNKDLVTHVGYWMRAADRVIQKFFQDSSVDPLIVCEIATQAANGPSTYDPNNQVVLFRNLVSVMSTFPNGPDFSAIWVETRNLSTPSDVERKTILEVLQTRGTSEDETYDLPNGYDPTETDWIVENQPGMVTYNNNSPATGENIRATLRDNDGGVSNRRYQWQSFANDVWSNVTGAANRAWTITGAGTYRCRVRYTDNYGPNQEAFGAGFNVT